MLFSFAFSLFCSLFACMSILETFSCFVPHRSNESYIRQYYKSLCLLSKLACYFCHLCDYFFYINFFEKLFRNMPSECQTVSIQKSGSKFCRAWSGSKLFANVICRWHWVGNELCWKWSRRMFALTQSIPSHICIQNGQALLCFGHSESCQIGGNRKCS